MSPPPALAVLGACQGPDSSNESEHCTDDYDGDSDCFHRVGLDEKAKDG